MQIILINKGVWYCLIDSFNVIDKESEILLLTALISVMEIEVEMIINISSAVNPTHRLEIKTILRDFIKKPLTNAVLLSARYCEINLRLAAGKPRAAIVDKSIDNAKAYT